MGSRRKETGAHNRVKTEDKYSESLAYRGTVNARRLEKLNKEI